MKKYRTHIIIGIMVTLIALIFLFWDDIKAMFAKPKAKETTTTIDTNTNGGSGGKPKTKPNIITEPSKFGVWAKLNFGFPSVDILAEYNKQKITDIPNGSFIGEYLGTSNDNKYYRVDYGGAPALVLIVQTNKKPL